MDIEELKARLRAVCDTGCDPDLPFEAADAIDQLQRELENKKIVSATMQHGYRIASDNCVRLERELEEARRQKHRSDLQEPTCSRCGADRLQEGCKNPSPFSCLFAGPAHDTARQQAALAREQEEGLRKPRPCSSGGAY